MSAKTFTLEAAKEANIRVAGNDKGAQAVHDLIVAYQANRRTGSANTKTRGEVRGNNKKIFRQKGTGNARHGDKRAPIFVGGGVVFGPRPRDYSKKVNKSTRRLALRRILGDIIEAGKVISVPSFEIADGKTKSFLAAMNELTPLASTKRVMVVSGSFDELTYRAGRNVQNILLMTAAEVNIEHLLNAKAVIFVDSALETFAKRTA